MILHFSSMMTAFLNILSHPLSRYSTRSAPRPCSLSHISLNDDDDEDDDDDDVDDVDNDDDGGDDSDDKRIILLDPAIAGILSSHLQKSAHERTKYFRVPFLSWALFSFCGRPRTFTAPTICIILQIMVDKSAHEKKFLAHLFRVGSFPTSLMSVLFHSTDECSVSVLFKCARISRNLI